MEKVITQWPFAIEGWFLAKQLTSHPCTNSNHNHPAMATSSDLELKNSFDDRDQRVIMKFLFALKNTAAELYRLMVKVFGKSTVGETTVRRWFQHFKSADYDIEEHRGGDHTSGPESEERVALVQGAFDRSRNCKCGSLPSIPQLAHGSARQSKA